MYILKPSGYATACQCELPSPPVFICITGSFDVGYRIVVACRDAKMAAPPRLTAQSSAPFAHGQQTQHAVVPGADDRVRSDTAR